MGKVEFDDVLLDRVAKALFLHDAVDMVPILWEACSPMTRRNYLGFAEAALRATFAPDTTDDQFIVCGEMPIEDHPIYKFCSEPQSTIEAAEKIRNDWADKYAADGATFTVEHTSRVRLNTYTYWSAEELERISAIAKKRAAELAEMMATQSKEVTQDAE